MAEPKHMVPCFLCGRPFQFGPHLYEGRYIQQWDVSACKVCMSMSWDGIVPEHHPRLMAHLAKRGYTVRLNAKGWLNIPNS